MFAPLETGDKVGLVCPASPVSKTDLETAENNIKELGFVPVLGGSVPAAERFLAGTDEARAADINAFFADDDIKAIFAVRGGYGSARILPLLDYDVMAAKPKLFVGISDITALQNAMFKKAGTVAPSGVALIKKMKRRTRESLLKCLAGESFSLSLGEFARKGAADGRLIGGCLSVFAGLIGTEYMPEVQGNILVLEDVGDEPYVVDRNLRQLLNAGIFNAVSGVVFGQFYKCKAKDKADGTVAEVIFEYADIIPCPVAVNFNYGHQPDSFVLPLGVRCEMSSVQGQITFAM